jgi:hypothetical protein
MRSDTAAGWAAWLFACGLAAWPAAMAMAADDAPVADVSQPAEVEAARPQRCLGSVMRSMQRRSMAIAAVWRR